MKNFPKLCVTVSLVMFVLVAFDFAYAKGGPVMGDSEDHPMGNSQSPNPPMGNVQSPNPPATAPQTFTLQNPLSSKISSIGGLVQTFIEVFSYLAVILGVLVLIWVGFQYILAAAQGKKDKITELHSWLLWAVVGIGIVIAARVMVQVVINTISATGVVNQNVIDTVKNAASGN